MQPMVQLVTTISKVEGVCLKGPPKILLTVEGLLLGDYVRVAESIESVHNLAVVHVPGSKPA